MKGAFKAEIQSLGESTSVMGKHPAQSNLKASKSTLAITGSINSMTFYFPLHSIFCYHLLKQTPLSWLIEHTLWWIVPLFHLNVMLLHSIIYYMVCDCSLWLLCAQILSMEWLWILRWCKDQSCHYHHLEGIESVLLLGSLGPWAVGLSEVE